MRNSEKKIDQVDLRVETIKGPEQSGASICPERGGLVTSMIIGGKELLYLDEDSFKDLGQKVRGGIPILYPNAGPLREGRQFDLKQHGYARLSDKWIMEKSGQHELVESLTGDKESGKLYPFDTIHRLKVKLEDDGSISIGQEAENLEKKKPAPVSFGLHPYFRVKSKDKKRIKFDFEGGDLVTADFVRWSKAGTTSIDNPKIRDPKAVLRVTLPGLGTIVMEPSIEYRKIWVWSEPGKDFICIEPVMRDPGGLVEEPELISPGKKFRASISYKMK